MAARTSTSQLFHLVVARELAAGTAEHSARMQQVETLASYARTRTRFWVVARLAAWRLATAGRRPLTGPR
jgi:hypothetical protein